MKNKHLHGCSALQFNWHHTVILALLPTVSPAQTALPHCTPQPLETISLTEQKLPSSVAIESDHTRSHENLYHMDGDVLLRHTEKTLEADTLEYNDVSGLATAKGHIHYQTPEIAIRGDSARLNIPSEEGVIAPVHYRFKGRDGQGRAEQMNIVSRQFLHLENATYSTCREEQIDWELHSKSLELDQETETGTATHVSLWFKDVPILYLPYLQFPLTDARRSGVLVPGFGVKNETGTEFTLPVYWNIAPDRDATFTPRFMSKRGWQLGTEFRYLSPGHRGTVQAEYLPDDDLTSTDRGLIDLRHTGHGNRWLLNLRYSQVSDTDYFSELGNNLDLASLSHLEQSALLQYNHPSFSVSSHILGFQTVDETIPGTSRPYKTLPRIRWQSSSHWRSLEMGLSGEYVRFERKASTTGERFHLKTSFGLPWRSPGIRFEPQLHFAHTRYGLDSASPALPSRSLPMTSVDLAAWFERKVQLFDRSMLQTLEPRVQHLWVPYREQSQYPVFDSSLIDLSGHTLFRHNRFNGLDRIGNTNQLSVSLGSRVLDPGRSFTQYLHTSVGQIYYFTDRTVTLPNQNPDTATHSDWLAEIALSLPAGFTVRSDLRWNTEQDAPVRATLSSRYRHEHGKHLELGYRYHEAILNQGGIGGRWSVNPRWHVFGHWIYSLRNRGTIEKVMGLEHQDCCWGLSIVHRDYINQTDGTNTRSIFFQLELKGLSRLGKSIDEVPGHAILGR